MKILGYILFLALTAITAASWFYFNHQQQLVQSSYDGDTAALEVRLNASNKHAEEDAITMQNKLDELRQSVTDLEKEIPDLEARTDRINEEMQAAEQKYRGANERVANFGSKMQEELNQLNLNLLNAQEQLNDVKQKRVETESQIVTLRQSANRTRPNLR